MDATDDAPDRSAPHGTDTRGRDRLDSRTRSPQLTRAVGFAALAGGVLALLLGPLHALARLRLHPDELTGTVVTSWAVPASEVLHDLLTFAAPDVVYRVYGLVWFPALAAAAACAWTVRRLRAGRRGRVETVGWWLTLPGLVLLSSGAFVSYWLGLVSPGFVALTLPGLLLGMVGQTTLGVGLLLARARPVVLAVLLTLVLPLVIAATSAGSQALGALVVVLVWAVAGASLVRETGFAERRPDASGRP